MLPHDNHQRQPDKTETKIVLVLDISGEYSALMVVYDCVMEATCPRTSLSRLGSPLTVTVLSTMHLH
ncbi:unnamed protein product [Coregonus sp. 'balchen']|nr:unnamed protein product [Coregonus sp. 'balchen']